MGALFESPNRPTDVKVISDNVIPPPPPPPPIKTDNDELIDYVKKKFHIQKIKLMPP